MAASVIHWHLNIYSVYALVDCIFGKTGNGCNFVYTGTKKYIMVAGLDIYHYHYLADIAQGVTLPVVA